MFSTSVSLLIYSFFAIISVFFEDRERLLKILLILLLQLAFPYQKKVMGNYYPE